MTTAVAAPTILTLQEAADYLRVSTRTLYSQTAPRGPIRAIHVGPRTVRYSLRELERFIADREAGCSAGAAREHAATETGGK